MPGEQGSPSYEVLAALVVSLRRELAEAVAALEQGRAELAQARERIAELEARLKQNPELFQAAVERGADQAGAEAAVAAEEERTQARRAGRA